MNKKILMVTVDDVEFGGDYTALFLNIEELFAYLDDVKKDTGYTPKILKTEIITLQDVIAGNCNLEHDYRVETVARVVLKDEVYKAFHKVSDLENVLNFLGIHIEW